MLSGVRFSVDAPQIERSNNGFVTVVILFLLLCGQRNFTIPKAAYDCVHQMEDMLVLREWADVCSNHTAITSPCCTDRLLIWSRWQGDVAIRTVAIMIYSQSRTPPGFDMTLYGITSRPRSQICHDSANYCVVGEFYTVSLKVKRRIVSPLIVVRIHYSVQDRRLESEDPEEVKWLMPQKASSQAENSYSIRKQGCPRWDPPWNFDDKKTEWMRYWCQW